MYSTKFLSIFGDAKKLALSVALATLCMLIPAAGAIGQSANVYGQVSNFDVINHTEHEGHGFEIELEGIHPEDIPYTFSAQRYGLPEITSTATGARVRWASPYVDGAFTKTTIAHAAGTPFAGSCYQWGANYDGSGCEHFGVSLTATPVKTTYRWLIEDVDNPGTLVGFDPPMAIVAPVYVITPPVRAGDAPVLEAEIEAPEAAEGPEVYGDAQWVRVYKTQLNREVSLDELVTTNAIVPQDAAHVETAWEIVQQEPVSHSHGNGNRGQRRHQAALNFDTRSVVRRFETYAFTGAYDPVTHEALCADTLCNAPGDGELGEFISAQMAAANVTVNSVAVTKNGSGTVSSNDRLINCGSKCGAGYERGAAVTLTASPAKDNIFSGWGGACSGMMLTCSLSVNDAMAAVANFTPLLNISVKTSGKGLVVAPAVGINCGKNCSASVARGTAVTFTATAESGYKFVNWSGGGCSGTALTCTATVSAAGTVTANFAK